MRTFLIISVIMNFIFLGIFLYNLDKNESSGNQIIITDSGEASEVGDLPKTFCEFVATFQEGDMNQNFLTKDFTKYKEDGFYLLLQDLLKISEDEVSEYDWNIMNNVLLSQNCDKKSMRPDDYELCTLLSEKNINDLQSYDYGSATKRNLVNSVLDKQNKCGDDLECFKVWNMLESIKNKNITLPDLLEDYKALDFYAYKKIFPETYESDLLKEFHRACTNEKK